MPALRNTSLLLLFACAACNSIQPAPAWPQGTGPNGNWTVRGPQAPRSFSVTADTNTVWRTALPETGQGGIAVANDRLFVATMAPWTGEGLSEADASKYSHAIEKRDSDMVWG